MADTHQVPEVLVRVAIACCTGLMLALPLGAQDTASAALDTTTSQLKGSHRNPRVAGVLGTLVPGAGHIYAGEYLNGFMNYELTVMSIGGGVLVFMVGECTFSFLSASKCDPGPEWPRQIAGLALVGVGVWRWIASAQDAPRAAERANARHRARSRVAKPIIAPFSGPENTSRVGVSFGW